MRSMVMNVDDRDMVRHGLFNERHSSDTDQPKPSRLQREWPSQWIMDEISSCTGPDTDTVRHDLIPGMHRHGSTRSCHL